MTTNKSNRQMLVDWIADQLHEANDPTGTFDAAEAATRIMDEFEARCCEMINGELIFAAPQDADGFLAGAA